VSASAVPGVDLQARLGPFPACIDADLVRRYAAATADANPCYLDGGMVPPAAIVSQIFDAQLAGIDALVAADVFARARSGVHGQHDMVLHRPVVPGEPLSTFVEAVGARPAGDNLRVILRHATLDARRRLVAEQWWTTVLLGTTCDPAGADAPGHAFPETAPSAPTALVSLYVDEGMPRRYAEVSGDYSPHHFDADAARRSGASAVFLHGLCTMGLCARAVVDTLAAGDPRLVCRLALRFASPTYPGHDLAVRLYELGPGAFAFEADCAGAKVITHGRAELRDQPSQATGVSAVTTSAAQR
jgi:acyl dehydratase